MKITQNDLKNIENYMYNKTRDLELAIYNALVDGDALMVTYALSMYQNRDGGFGKGLNPDTMDNESSVFQTVFALEILDLVNEKISDEMTKQMVDKALRYLMNKEYTGVIKALSSSYMNYSHKKDLCVENLDLEYTILAYTYVMKYKGERTNDYKTANMRLQEIIKNYLSLGSTNNVCRALIKACDVINDNELNERLHVDIKIYMTTENWVANDFFMPVNFLSNFASDFQESYDKNIDFLISSRTFLGVWDLDYQCEFVDEEDYDVARIKWAGILTVRYVAILLKNQRILVI